MNAKPTPRTDAATSFIKCYPNSGEGFEVVDSDFARQLETQVAELREALKQFADMDTVDLGKASLNNVRDDFMYECPEYVSYCNRAKMILERMERTK